MICTSKEASTSDLSGHEIMLNKRYESEMMNNLAHLIVEYLTKSMMDFQWPDEESMSAFIERDLEIKNKIEAIPILWNVLVFIANS